MGFMKELLMMHAAFALISLGEGIMMGSEVKPHSHPYMASIQVAERGGAMRHVCGGFLVELQWVMTSAHCLWKTKLRVVLGAHSLTPEVTQQTFGVTQRIRRYVSGYYAHDIGLIKLDRPATVTPTVNTVKYQQQEEQIVSAACRHFAVGCPQPAYPPVGAEVITAGWGQNWNSTARRVLNQAFIEVKDQGFCEVSTGDYLNLLCATAFRNCYGCACEGDLGNPLLLNGVVVGITTQWDWETCGRIGTHRMYYTYTMVSRHTDWIKHIMRKKHAKDIYWGFRRVSESFRSLGLL